MRSGEIDHPPHPSTCRDPVRPVLPMKMNGSIVQEAEWSIFQSLDQFYLQMCPAFNCTIPLVISTLNYTYGAGRRYDSIFYQIFHLIKNIVKSANCLLSMSFVMVVHQMSARGGNLHPNTIFFLFLI